MTTKPPTKEEVARAASLLEAQNKAVSLFAEIEQTLIRPGVSEKTISDEIHALAQSRHNVRTHWHKRVVRSGPNTLLPFQENPPDRTVLEDDILYVDLGPVFEEYEADFGKTFVLGGDPEKIRLRDALVPAWDAVSDKFRANPDITGDELYAFAKYIARQGGWTFGSEIAGHLIGLFPHERIPKDRKMLYITEGNDHRMNDVGKDGFKRHWILEMHLHKPEKGYGGFFEKLLTIG
jgi:Xaa-Pro aminopeptidase